MSGVNELMLVKLLNSGWHVVSTISSSLLLTEPFVVASPVRKRFKPLNLAPKALCHLALALLWLYCPQLPFFIYVLQLSLFPSPFPQPTSSWGPSLTSSGSGSCPTLSSQCCPSTFLQSTCQVCVCLPTDLTNINSLFPEHKYI